ncbi:uncharacterized protein LOC127791085 [Diospyros lotus]|uniref:uncharacterized protein LOC127791085 n=1 Tax=Diospyros lotus TaxID=55363 RepID=UPI00224E40B6|nr:uncharacterized protein LOC127791085 [Diospyros lotus]
MTLSSTVTPMAKSIFKAQIFRSNGPIVNATRAGNGASCLPSAERLARIRLAVLPPHLRARPLPVEVRHRSFLPRPPLPSLLQSRPPPLSALMTSVTDPAPDDSRSGLLEQVRVVVKGTVQGVFYRDWTVENAKELGLQGWVRNRRDGSVEALFYGTDDKVHEMRRRCWRGPPAARVTNVEVYPCSDDPGTGFVRKPTV